ncbi:hypothetical protein BDV96DRAFT_649879 [Lophiotrema nucula]|uniref:Uncharacterized protein n=1 Tax=Lophiotrema nucula TaxID=690887 RepID=A0A6A5Z0P3_9PLEO|nr:hypothetical protein BDV96DRAFT_649879 [Lophiotrema nucula]
MSSHTHPLKLLESFKSELCDRNVDLNVARNKLIEAFQAYENAHKDLYTKAMRGFTTDVYFCLLTRHTAFDDILDLEFKANSKLVEAMNNLLPKKGESRTAEWYEKNINDHIEQEVDDNKGRENIYKREKDTLWLNDRALVYLLFWFEANLGIKVDNLHGEDGLPALLKKRDIIDSTDQFPK